MVLTIGCVAHAVQDGFGAGSYGLLLILAQAPGFSFV